MVQRVIEREQIVANVLASQRLAGLEPGEHTRAVLDAWARGELGDEDLDCEQAAAVARHTAGAALAVV